MTDKTNYEQMRKMEAEHCSYQIDEIGLDLKVGDTFTISNEVVEITDFGHTNNAGSRTIYIHFDNRLRMRLGEFILQLDYIDGSVERHE